MDADARHSSGGVVGRSCGARGKNSTLRHAKAKTALTELSGWVRCKLRCVRLQQRKRAKAIADFLSSLGIGRDQRGTAAASGKGWWRLAHHPVVQQAMNNAWFQAQGLLTPLERYLALQH